MSNKRAIIIIGLQALLIVILFWMLIFYGKDEFEDFRVVPEEEIESPDRVTEADGISVVSLSLAVQKNSGISSAIVKIMSYQDEIKSYGSVVPINALMNARNKVANLKLQLTSSSASNKQYKAQHESLKVLNADDKNISDLTVQKAQAKVRSSHAMVVKTSLQIQNLETSMKLKWGTLLANAALGKQSLFIFKNLVNRKNTLIQISLPFNSADPKAGDVIEVMPLNGTNPIKATYVSAAASSDHNGNGKTFYYSAPSGNLRVGMRVRAQANTSKSRATNGIIIPSNAVVWYAGTPWAYFKQDSGKFVRKPISADTEVDAGWFNTGFAIDSEVVVKGAQLLLSEEFKYLIKNENDD